MDTIKSVFTRENIVSVIMLAFIASMVVGSQLYRSTVDVVGYFFQRIRNKRKKIYVFKPGLNVVLFGQNAKDKYNRLMRYIDNLEGNKIYVNATDVDTLQNDRYPELTNIIRIDLTSFNPENDENKLNFGTIDDSMIDHIVHLRSNYNSSTTETADQIYKIVIIDVSEDILKSHNAFNFSTKQFKLLEAAQTYIMYDNADLIYRPVKLRQYPKSVYKYGIKLKDLME